MAAKDFYLVRKPIVFTPEKTRTAGPEDPRFKETVIRPGTVGHQTADGCIHFPTVEDEKGRHPFINDVFAAECERRHRLSRLDPLVICRQLSDSPEGG